MKAIMIYRPNSDHERMVLDYLRDYAAQTGRALETVDADSKEGDQLSSLYDIMDYPAIIVTSDDGTLQNIWIGTVLPRISDVSYFSLGER